MKFKGWSIFILVLTAGLAGFGFYQYKQKQKPQIRFREVKPFYGSIQKAISTTGTVQPQNRLEIKPPISGRMDEILVKEGDPVKTGQTIAWMSSTDRAALLDTARSNGEKAVEYWKDVYKPTPLIAPIDGEVIVRALEPGQTVTSNDVVLVLSDRLIVQANVDETDIGKVKKGQTAAVSLDAYPDIRVEGKVNHIYYESKIVNNVTIYHVDILPETVPEVFRSGMSANIEIIEQSKEHVLLISQEAVKQDPEYGSFVLVPASPGQRPRREKITTGLADDTNFEVVEGLDADSTVLVRTENYTPSRGSPGGNPFMPFGGRRKKG
ncbi:MAG: efflux RND transporter periplasmic adaptor subunit [Candidatus Aureabacteria bacterium]|nr:efflux RND transporter periplasmic adaptor subunit [Candidatus Auribacterota bacterium]